MMHRFLFALLVSLTPVLSQDTVPQPSAAPTATPPPPKLDTVVLPAEFWTQAVESLSPALASLKFSWISTARDGARSVSPDLSLAGYPIAEAVFRFAEDKPYEALLLFYSRGLSREVNERLFDELIENVQKSISAQVGSEPQKKARDIGSVVRSDGVEWVAGPTKLTLEWSASKSPFRAEFLRLLVRPNVEQKRAIGEVAVGNTNRAAVKNFVGADHVVKADGDVKLIDIPMVDQGERGYCVVATVERVMRYYGATVDQTELAQIANSDASKGTSSAAMVESLRKLTGRLGVKVKTLEETDVNSFLKLIDDYNRAAKRGKVGADKRSAEIRAIQGNVIDVERCYQQMDPEIFREVRLKKAADVTKFQRDIVKNIDEGIPLLWSVNIGMVPEGHLKQYRGGHMRLITGYNAAKNEILYSDSWGPGHEEKRMPLEDAWVITSGVNSLQPIGS